MSSWAVLIATFVLGPLKISILVYFLALNSFYAIQLFSAARDFRVHYQRTSAEQQWRLLRSDLVPRISVLVPAHNEAATITGSLQAILTLDYPALEVVVVDDGSADGTLGVMQAAFDLYPVHPIYQRRLTTQPIRSLFRSRAYPFLLVVSKANGGKADALNAAVNCSQGDLVCAIDADTLIENDAMQRMARPFIERPDTLASGGTIRVVNAAELAMGRVQQAHVPKRPLVGMQTVEYLRAFLFGRVGWNRLGGNLIVSGAFGLFRRSVVVDAGGYARDSVGEDMELIIRLRRYARQAGLSDRIPFIPDPVAWTEVPERAAQLGRQRERWHRGLTDALWRHRAVLFNPRYGVLGLWVAPIYLLGEWASPIVEAVGLIGSVLGLAFGLINLPFAAAFLLLAYGYGLLISLLAIFLEEVYQPRFKTTGEKLLLICWACLEPLGYRQMTVWWRLQGIIRYLRGVRDWGEQERQGFARGSAGA